MRALYSIKKKFFSYYTTAKSPSTTFLYLWGSFTTTSTFLSLSSSNTAFLLFSIQHHLHHISLFPPPTHTHVHTRYQPFLLFSIHHLHRISFVFPAPPPPPQFYCFLSTIFTTTSFLLFLSTTSNTFLWFLIRYIHHISILSLHHYLHHIPIVFHLPPRPPFCCFPSTTLTTFLLFFLHHLHHHISIVFLFPLRQYQISKASPSCTTTL